MEIKDLKQIVDLEERSTNKSHETKHEQYIFKCLKCEYKTKLKVQLSEHMNEEHSGNLLKCEKCHFQAKTQMQINNHFDEHHIEKQFNCEECPFQGTTQLELNKHTNLKHRSEGQIMENVIKCKHCGEQFSEIWNLMNHRKQAHKNAVTFCRNIKLTGKCKFASDKCWWNHEKSIVGKNTSDTNCYICHQTFGSKGDMMIHRKHNHGSMVKECTDFEQNRCRFKEQFCWYKHENNIKIEDSTNKDTNQIEIDETNSVFRNAQENLAPPSRI